MTAKFHMNYEAPMVGATHSVAEQFVQSAGNMAAAVTRMFEGAVAAVQRWQSRVEQRQHLHEMDAHLLKDLGFSREQADAEASKPFWRA